METKGIHNRSAKESETLKILNIGIPSNNQFGTISNFSSAPPVLQYSVLSTQSTEIQPYIKARQAKIKQEFKAISQVYRLYEVKVQRFLALISYGKLQMMHLQIITMQF